MAVVSISRIQIRRGRKNGGTGLPQLASGEFGWAVDTQELFIGNGSVAEGAPYVGNTKILSEHDNILEFATAYQYRPDASYIQTGANTLSPVQRSLQERLDDRVSIRSFGANGDGNDQTAALQRAIYSLYLNGVTNYTPTNRVIIYVEPGEYVINSTIYLPPYTTIRGAGIDKTIFRMTGVGPAFETISSLSTQTNPVSSSPSLSYDNQSRNIDISDITIDIDDLAGFNLINCRHSSFTNIKITGTWEKDTGKSTYNYGIKLTALNSTLTCQYNTFNNVTINGVGYGVISDYDINDNIWVNCHFDINAHSVMFGENTVIGSVGQVTGPVGNIFENCTFDNVNEQAIKIYYGSKNVSRHNKFFNVGNSGGDHSDIAFSIIEFDQAGNISDNDWFERTSQLSYNSNYSSVKYLPEIKSPSIVDSNFTHVLSLGYSPDTQNPTRLFRLPADAARAYEIEYSYISSAVNARRTGKLSILVDPSNDTKYLVDDFDYIGESTYEENLEFSLRNYDYSGNLIVDTIGVMVVNLTANDEAELYYKITIKY